MDDLKLPAFRKDKENREIKISLDERIRGYGKINSDASKLLLAVKWIGNEGNHASLSRLDGDDLLDVFELLEWVLEETYSRTKERLSAIADAINAAKGKPDRGKAKK